jgi:hypothetical protein
MLILVINCGKNKLSQTLIADDAIWKKEIQDTMAMLQ